MAVAFTDKEKAGIIQALRDAATRHASQGSMRKTSVEELATEAGISKGAFYKFYPSKEHLFLDVLEQWHGTISRQAEETLKNCRELSAPKRAANMLKAAWRDMRDQSLARFRQEELPLLLRKLPEAVLRDHYLSDEEFVRRLIRLANVKLTVSETQAYATVRILFLSLMTAQQVGEGYEEALDKLIDGACQLMVRDET